MKYDRYLLGIVLLVAGALPMFAQFSGTVSDSQGVQYTANDDESTCYISGHEDSYSVTIEIPEVYNGRRVTSIGDWVFHSCRNLVSVNIPSSVTSIGISAFSGCIGLKLVTIPSSVTSIGQQAFMHCYGLMSLTISEGVTSIGRRAFDGCSGLTSLTIPSSMKWIDRQAFRGCSGLKSLTIPEGVTSIGSSAFDGCSGLASLTIPASVTSIADDTFKGCSGLTSIVVVEGNTVYDSRDNCNAIINTADNALMVVCKNTVIPSSVKSISSGAFAGCSYLTSVTIPKGVTSIGQNAFQGCSGLTSLTIPSSVTSIGESAFEGCSGLISVTIPSSVTSIGRCAFEGCSGLTSLKISEGVTSIDNSAFKGCSSLTSVTIPSSVTSISWSVFDECIGLSSIVVESGNTVYDSRDNCNAIIKTSDNTLIVGCKNAVIPSSVTSIGVSAFYGCSGLTSITIPEGVKSIGYDAFKNCSSLTSVTIPSSVTSISAYAFQNCSELTSVTILTSVTSIGESAFEGCSRLTSVTIPSSVTSIGRYAFSGCCRLTSVTIPSSVTSISDGTFKECSGLTSVTIPSSVTSIGDAAFSGCSGLTAVTIPSSVTSIGYVAFNQCRSLTSVTIPSSVMSIGGGAFFCCSGMTSVTIPSSVTSIGSSAFTECSSLKSVIVGWEAPLEIEAFTFDNSNNNNATLYVPKGTKAAYETASIWKDFDEVKEIFDKSDGALSDSQGLRYTANDDESTCYVSGHNNTYSADIVIPKIFNGRNVTSIGTGAFNGCSDLTSLTVKWRTPIAIDGNIFEDSNCHNAVLRVPVGSKGAYDVAEVWNDFGTILEWFDSTDGVAIDTQGVKYIANEDESTCYVSGYITSCNANIEIPGVYKGRRVTSIGERAFYDCSSLTSVTIPSSVTSIGRSAFSGCSGLTSLIIPSSVTSISNGAFGGCSSLTTIVVEEDNTVYDSRGNCNAIIRTSDNTLIVGCKSTVIPTGVTSIGRSAFYHCSSLTSVTIPSSVMSIGDFAFTACRSLTSVTIPSSVTSIGEYAFGGCSSLTSVTIPSSVTSIGSNAFYDCSGLTSVTIPSSVTSIGSNAFRDCSSLTSVTIPSSVTSISDYAFDGCSSLKSLFVEWETPLEVDNVFYRSNNQNAILLVPKGTKAAYESAAVWQDFGTIFEGVLPQDNVELTDASAIDNVIYMEPIEATKGRETTVSLKMKNTAGIRGFQFDMQLPLGVTVKKDGNDRFVSSLNDKRLPSGSAHTLTVSEQQDGAIRFLCGSQYDETFTGTDGEILTVRLCLDEQMLDGQYPILLKDVKLTETNINNYYETATVQTAMTVISYTPGDISGDGEIDVSDYIGVANYIMGNTPAGFVAAAADVNKDQKVDVSDYIGIANLILYNNIYGQTVSAARSAERRRVNTDVSTLDNVIYISPFEAASNGETQMSIRMKNTVGIRGFQFDLYLPDGMTAVKDGNNRYISTLSSGRKPAGDQHTLTLSEQPDGAIRFLCGSQYDETFTGTDGEIATLTISIDASVEAQDYPIYLRNMKLTETDISQYYTTNEIETSVTVTGPSDGRVVLRETATSLPVVDETEEVNVVVYRTLKAGEWSTICLPFDMDEDQLKEFFGDEVQLAKYQNYSATKTGSDVTGISISFATVDLADEGFEANVPYMIKPSKTEDITSFELTTMVDPADVKAGSNKKGWFYGTYEAETVVPENSLFLNGNKFYYSTGKTKMKAFRAYLTLPVALADVANASSRIALSFDDATDVKELKSSKIEELKSYYNLKGQRVEKPVKKGLYIQNGKKVVNK